jgi:16S rRNA (cytosine967-C5)-methyltransferase
VARLKARAAGAGHRTAQTKPGKGVAPPSLWAAAADVLKRLTQSRWQVPTDAALSEHFKGDRRLASRDRALLADGVYTSVRHWQSLSQVAKQAGVEHLGESWSSLEHRVLLLAWPVAEVVVLKLPDGARQWLAQAQAQRLPQAAVDELPTWLFKQLSEEIDDAADFAHSVLQSAQVDLRVNSLFARRDEVQQSLLSEGVTTSITPHSPIGLRLNERVALAKTAAMKAGHIELQDEGSQLIALLVGARRHDTVVDFCAGGGGKALAMGAAMRNTCKLVAIDTSAARLAELRPRALRAGLSQVYTMAVDHESDERLERLVGKAQRVLVDAPCTGLGTLRRSPELKWKTSPDDVSNMALQQLSILRAASRLVAPGGRLVYATCSVLRAENEEVVQSFLAAHPDFDASDVQPVLEAAHVQNAVSLVTHGCMRLWPQRHGTDGFFAAVLTRRA